MKTKTFLTAVSILIASAALSAQDIFLSAFKKIPSGSTNEVDRISFSEDSKLLAVTDPKGSLAFIEIETSNVLKKEPASGKIIFHEFIDKDKKFLCVKSNGEFF